MQKLFGSKEKRLVDNLEIFLGDLLRQSLIFATIYKIPAWRCIAIFLLCYTYAVKHNQCRIFVPAFSLILGLQVNKQYRVGKTREHYGCSPLDHTAIWRF